MPKRLLFAATMLLAFSGYDPTTVFSDQFYKGKTVRLMVGFSPGGGPDVRTRLVARHIGKHIPGNPRIIVQNMPGAGGRVVANYLYNVAKPDGLTLGSLNRDIGIMQLGGVQGIKFDMGKFLWIGNVTRQGNIVFIRSNLPYKNVKELRNAKKPLIFAARAIGATNYLAAKGMGALGVPVKVVLGYGSRQLTLAFEQGEVDASALGWTALVASRPDWVKRDGIARLIVEFGAAPTPGVQFPFGPNLKALPGKQGIYSLINKALGLPVGNLAAPPGTPTERIEELRSAYRNMARDQKFQTDAARIKISVDNLGGKELASTFQAFLDAPPADRTQFEKLFRK
jgi:tripartite-type tricarboxylate transporter receptor subunit TctC